MKEMYLSYVIYNLDDGNDYTPIGVYGTEDEAISVLIEAIGEAEEGGDFVDHGSGYYVIQRDEKEYKLKNDYQVTTGFHSTAYRYEKVNVYIGNGD